MTCFRHLLFALLCVALSGCAVREQALVADSLAGAVNVATAELAERYQLEGERAIAVADSRVEAEALLDRVRDRWTPVWLTLRAFAAAHDAWATYLERGELAPSAVFSAALRAWCDFAQVARLRGEPLPPIMPCGGAP